MSRTKEIRRRMRETRRMARARRRATGQARNERRHNKERSHEMSNSGSGGVMILDKMTGEVREGGIELFEEYNRALQAERKMFLASTNPSYLAGRVTQNKMMFSADEIREMIDATFECAGNGSRDAWYPNQYALAIALEAQGFLMSAIGYFLLNFELGLRISGQRAARHLGRKDWIKESAHLSARLRNPASLDDVSDEDCLALKSHVMNHPRFHDAMSWYQRESGGMMMTGAA